MKKQTTTKRRKLFIGLAIFCLLGFFVSIISLGPFEAITYALFSVLFFVLWIKKPITIKEQPPIIISTHAPSTQTNINNNTSVKSNKLDASSKVNVQTTSYKTERFHVTGTSH